MITCPEISVVMTAFNAEDFIKEAIDSMLNQTFNNFEFIIVDNASTDKTKEIINSFSDKRIVFIKNRENFGQTKALNIGIRHSRGKYIARMDADDISLPQRLEFQHKYLEQNKSIAVLGSWYLEIDENGKTIRKFKLPTDPLDIKCYLSGSSGLSYHCVPHPIVLMRRDALFEVGLYNERYTAQDYDLWIRISRNYHIANLNKVLFKYRIRKDSQSGKLSTVFHDDCEKTIIENISYYLPELKKNDSICLMRMLCFLPQKTRQNGEKILSLFDKFFNARMLQHADEARVKKNKDRMKLYYLPQLFFTNKKLSIINTALKLIIRQPGILMDKKLYAKILKTVFGLRQQFVRTTGRIIIEH